MPVLDQIKVFVDQFWYTNILCIGQFAREIELQRLSTMLLSVTTVQ